jgi:MFS family permease
MWVQTVGIALVAVGDRFGVFAAGAVLLGVGTAMVYPTLLAAIGDVAHPSWRASAVGVYRLWRDLGYAIGAVLAGLTADAFGLSAAMWIVAAVTFASGAVVAARMTETHQPQRKSPLSGAVACGGGRTRSRSSRASGTDSCGSPRSSASSDLQRSTIESI